MELTGDHIIDATRDRVWAGLMDTDILRAAIPGCDSVTEEGDGAYSAVVTAAIGPMRARFKGRLQQQDMRPPEQYGLRFEGEGGIAGFAKGTAVLTLEEAGEGGAQTRLRYRAEAAIGGRLAQIGSRLIDATARRMAGQFFGKFEELLNAPQTAAAETAPRPAPTVDAQSASARPPDSEAPAAARPRAPAAAPGLVTLQMPAWAFSVTVTVLAGLAAWISIQ